MKQKLILLLCALLSSLGIWAIDVKIANTSSGLPTAAGFGSFSGLVFTTANGSGLAGVTVTAASGVTIGEQTVNVADYGNCFKIVTAAGGTDYRITLAVPDGYVITGYNLSCSANSYSAAHTLTSEDGSVSVVASSPPYNNPTGPKSFEVTGLNAQSTYFTINTANKGNTLFLPHFSIMVVPVGTKIVDVTYDLYESDGITKVTSVVVQQEAGSNPVIPEDITSNTFYTYDYAGTIGDENCIIKVIRTLKDGSIICPISKLSNTKAYKIVVPRGTYTVNNGKLANTVKDASYPVNYFALISYEDKYYMWSLEAGKFVAGNEANLTDTPVPVSFAASTSPSFLIKSGSNTLNATSGFETGAGFDSWSAADMGNQCIIYEVEDFNPSDVLSTIELYLSSVEVNFAVNVTGVTEAENTRVGKFMMSVNNETVNKYLYADTETQTLGNLPAALITATATSYRGYEFTGFSVGDVDYGTSIEIGELANLTTGSTIVANYTATTGNGLNLWYDYSDDNSAAYRIPAIIRTQSGRLIAFSDYRPGFRDVGQGATSIERRYSDDGGETWSPALRIAEGNWGANQQNVIEWSFGDAAVVADNTPGNSGNDVLMISCGGNMTWPSSVYNPDLSQAQQGCVRWRSSDGGVTWSKYEYIMPDIMQAFVDAGLRAQDGSSGIVRAFFTSGKITQSVRKAAGAQYNRIYSAVDIPDENVVMYSDDFGETWKVLGSQVANNGDEAHVVELPDGGLLLVGRGGSSRWVNVFNYTDFDSAEGQWGPTGQWNNAVATSCNGDVEIVEAYDSYGEKNTVIVETAPMYSGQRREIQYYYIALPKATGFTTTDFSTVGGASWTKGMNVSPNWSAYSSLLNNGDGTFDILFEESAKNETRGPSGYCIVYQQGHSIQDITNRMFFFDKEQAETEAVKAPRPGHFYRFKGSASNAYLTGTAPLSTTSAADATTIWYLGTEGLVSYSAGLYLDGGAKSLAPIGTSYKAAIEPNSFYEGKYTIRTNNYYSYDRETNHSIDRGTGYNNDVRYAWIVEDVTSLPVSISTVGYATLFTPVSLEIPIGIKAYYGEDKGEELLFTKIEDGIIPANTGVILKGEEGIYNFNVITGGSASSILTGTFATINRPENSYIFADGSQGVAFYKDGASVIPAFKAYLAAESGGDVKTFYFNEEGATSLNEELRVKNEEFAPAVYDLAGRKLNSKFIIHNSQLKNGIYILNGKKVVL